jgi:hypothetical protein
VIGAVGCGSQAAFDPKSGSSAVSSVATSSHAATATSPVTSSAAPPTPTIGGDPDGCDGFDAYDNETYVGVPFDSVGAKVRAMLDGLRPSDVVQAPTTRDAVSATWRVIRAGGVVAEVEFLHNGDGWIPSTGEACGGLTFNS